MERCILIFDFIFLGENERIVKQNKQNQALASENERKCSLHLTHLHMEKLKEQKNEVMDIVLGMRKNQLKERVFRYLFNDKKL